MIFTALILAKNAVFLRQGLNSRLVLHFVDDGVQGCTLTAKGFS